MLSLHERIRSESTVPNIIHFRAFFLVDETKIRTWNRSNDGVSYFLTVLLGFESFLIFDEFLFE